MASQSTRWDRRDAKRDRRFRDMARDGVRQQDQRNAILKRLSKLNARQAKGGREIVI